MKRVLTRMQIDGNIKFLCGLEDWMILWAIVIFPADMIVNQSPDKPKLTNTADELLRRRIRLNHRKDSKASKSSCILGDRGGQLIVRGKTLRRGQRPGPV